MIPFPGAAASGAGSLAALALAFMTALAAPGQVRAGEGASTLQRPVLLPRDEAARDPSLFAFREALLRHLRAGELEAVAAMAHPEIKLSFGGSFGRDTFLRWLRENPEAAGTSYRQELERAVALGGVLLGPERFCTPYVFCLEIPGCTDCDPYETLVAVSQAAPVFAAPDREAAVVARIPYGVVTIIGSAPYPWHRVRVPGADGTAPIEGYVTAADFRSPIDYRALFERQSDGSWLITVFLAGD